ncbi:MAG: 3-phosphoshikimate 1-carboxyvinyltransferase [Clostridia bacterium]|nr:3-phosphoshikimate 1-carboxyvinyltransferase [Clostridia bacterium]
MKVKISPSVANGNVFAPPSKSLAHRLLICAGMSEDESIIHGISDSEDISATLDCLETFGATYTRIGEGDTIKIRGVDFTKASPKGVLPCRESGSTLRFFIPPALLSGSTTMFSGSETLMKRPMEVYIKLCSEGDMLFLSDGKSIVTKGKLKSGNYTVVGNISSQFISGLLFALPLCNGDSKISITPPIESRSYIDLTLSALETFGIKASWQDEHTIFIPGSQKYKGTEASVEGDYSNAAFLDAFNLLGGNVTTEGLMDGSLQGDSVYPRYFEMISKGSPSIHLGDCPDLGPIMFAMAAAKHGGVFSGTRRLKIKESDRANAMASELRKFGVTVSVSDDSVVIFPSDFHAPTETLFGHNDHRIVMSLAVLLTVCGGEIEGAEAINKSFPDFFEKITALGIGVTKSDT